jgi:hypothetical protein
VGLEWGDPNAYEQGVEYARKVQQALAQGQTFEDIPAFPPVEAVCWKTVVKQSRPGHADVQFWEGYLSRWD